MYKKTAFALILGLMLAFFSGCAHYHHYGYYPYGYGYRYYGHSPYYYDRDDYYHHGHHYLYER